MAFELLEDKPTSNFKLLDDAPTASTVQPQPSGESFLGTPIEEFNAFERFVLDAGRNAREALGVLEIPGRTIRDLAAGAPFGTGTTSRELVGADEPGQEPSLLRDVVLPTVVEIGTDVLPFFVGGPIKAATQQVGKLIGKKAAKAAPVAKSTILEQTQVAPRGQRPSLIEESAQRIRPTEIAGEGFTTRPAPPAIAGTRQLALEDLSTPVPQLETTAPSSPLQLPAPTEPKFRVPLGKKKPRKPDFIGTEQGDIVAREAVFAKPLTKLDKAAVRQGVKEGTVAPKDSVVPAEGMQPPKVVNSTPEDYVKQQVKDAKVDKPKVHYDEPLLDTKPLSPEKEIGVSQIVRDGISTLESTGPIGKQAGRVMRTLEQGWERKTSQGIVALEDVLTKNYGKRLAIPGGKRLNPLRTKGITKQWKVSEAENEALVNYLYTGGDEKWLAELNPLQQQRVKNISDRFFRETRAINEQAGIRGLMRFRPDGTQVPVGQPSMFFPQRPENIKLINKLSDNQLNKYLLRARVRQNNPHLTMSDFRAQMLGDFTKEGKLKFVRGLEDTRTFDASVGNTESAYKNLNEAGYGVDPLRNFAGYAIGANKKAALAENLDILTKLQVDLQEVLPKNVNFVNRMFDEFKGTSVELADEFATNFWAKVRSFNASTLLQFATANNLNQFTFIAQRGGVFNTVQAALSLRGFTIPVKGARGETQQITDVARKSGALFNIYMQELSAPRHFWSRWAQTLLHVNGFTLAEKWMRYTAANIGGMQSVMLAKSLLKNVNNPKKVALITKQLRELGIDADKVVMRGGLIEEEALGAAQRMANELAGRRTLSGVPAFVTNHGQLQRTLLQFKEFMFTNVAEMSRVIANSPSVGIGMKRLARGTGSALVIGEMTRDVSFLLTGGDTLFPSTKERVPKAMRDLFGNDTTARAVDNIVAGYSNIAMVLAATAAQGQSFAELVGGPSVGFVDDIFKKGIVRAVERRAIGPRQRPPDITDPFAGNDFGEGFGGF